MKTEDANTADMELIDLYSDEEKQVFDLSEKYKDDEKFLEYYAKKQAETLAAISVLELQHERRIKAVKNKLKALEYFNATRADTIVRRLISGQKRKSHDTAYGRFSVRNTSGYVKVRDAQQFIKGLDTFREDSDELLDAVVSYRPSIDAKQLKSRFKTMNGSVYLDGEPLTQNQINGLGLEVVNDKSVTSFSIPKEKNDVEE